MSQPDAPIVKATATAAKSGQTVTARINGAIVTVNTARDLTVASGDVLLVCKIDSKWFAFARVWAAAPAAVDYDPAPPAAAPAQGVLVVAPLSTGSYRDGAWRTDSADVVQGVRGGAGNSTGAAFYGSKPQTLAGATVDAATVTIQRLSGGSSSAQALTLRRLTENTQPAGAPTLAASSAGPSLVPDQLVEFAIPTSWAQNMVDGTAGGLGINVTGGTPYVRTAGRGSRSDAYTLRITWHR